VSSALSARSPVFSTLTFAFRGAFASAVAEGVGAGAIGCAGSAAGALGAGTSRRAGAAVGRGSVGAEVSAGLPPASLSAAGGPGDVEGATTMAGGGVARLGAVSGGWGSATIGSSAPQERQNRRVTSLSSPQSGH